MSNDLIMLKKCWCDGNSENHYEERGGEIKPPHHDQGAWDQVPALLTDPSRAVDGLILPHLPKLTTYLHPDGNGGCGVGVAQGRVHNVLFLVRVV